jgi:hypothetical protein
VEAKQDSAELESVSISKSSGVDFHSIEIAPIAAVEVFNDALFLVTADSNVKPGQIPGGNVQIGFHPSAQCEFRSVDDKALGSALSVDLLKDETQFGQGKVHRADSCETRGLRPGLFVV